jgi:hypothetical protein
VPAQRSTKATVEDVEDDEDEGRPTVSKKKKKKKPKKKKPAAASTNNEGKDVVIEPVSPIGPETIATPPQSPAPSTQTPDGVGSPRKRKKKKSSSGRSDSEPGTSPNPNNPLNASTSTFTSQLPAYASTTSLPLPGPQRAQSARSYVRSEGLTEKTKVKSRPSGPALEPIKEKKGFWSKFSKKEKEEKKEEDDDVVPRENWAVRMKEQTKMYVRQMIGTKEGLQPMKWENFLKVGLHHDPRSRPCSSLELDHEGDALRDRS